MTETRIIPTIPADIEAKRDQVIALCQRFGVIRLDLFGSSTIGRFNPDTSDYDFIVDLGPYAPGIAKRFFDLEDALARLLERRVDLNTEPSGRNRFYSASVSESRMPVFDAAQT